MLVLVKEENKIKKVKAIYDEKLDAVICKKCKVEIWEGVDCDCGVDGALHSGLDEAYKQKGVKERIEKE